MLTQEDRAQVERRLLEERGRAIEALREFDETFATSLQERAGELSVYRFHMADLGSEAMEQEQEFLLASNEGRRLYRIDSALRRLYDDPDSFGRCTRCGRDVSIERLDIVPESELCADCQRETEEESA